MRFRFALFFCLIFFLPQFAHAEEQGSLEPTKKDEYDFSWLDPDKKIYVVQNRKYLEGHRLEVAVNGGVGVGEAYRNRYIFEPRAMYYFDENWGAGLIGGFVSNMANDNYLNLKQVSTVLPTVRDVRSFIGATAMWTPFYGKVNMFNQILYMDWHFEAGFDSVNSQIDLNTNSAAAPNYLYDSHTGYHWGTGMKFFITQGIAARLDFLTLYYSAPQYLNGNTTTTTTAMFSNYFFTLGVSYTF